VKAYRVITAGDDRIVPARTRKEAIAKYFKAVRGGEITLDQLGQLIMIVDPDDGERYPLRVIPTVYNLGLMRLDEAAENVSLLLGISRVEARKTLRRAARKDQWILQEIKRLEEG